jgi:hypothetical protein
VRALFWPVVHRVRGRSLARVGLWSLVLALLVGCARANQSAPAAPLPVPASESLAAVRAAAAPTTGPAANAAAPAAAPAGGAAAGTPTTADLIALNRMVIRDGKLSLQVASVETALQGVRQIADAEGGWVSASHSYDVPDDPGTPPVDPATPTPAVATHMVADVTILVPSTAFDPAVQRVRGLATKVVSEETTSQDVTEQYVDVNAELQNLQTTESSLLKLMGQATQLNDILTLEQQLSSVRGQIDRLEGQQRYLEHATSMSTIEIQLRPVPAAAPPPVRPDAVPVWHPEQALQQGWDASLIGLEAVANALLVALAFGWWVLPFLTLAAYLYRRSRLPNRVASAPPAP